jgi:hypothetical protein
MNYKGNSIIGDKSYGKSKRKFKKIDLNVEKNITCKKFGVYTPYNKKRSFL